MIESRKICWPTPDATCLHGGCGWCEYGKWKTLDQVEAYAARRGHAYHRGGAQEDALVAYRYGLAHDFFTLRVPLRTSRERLETWACTLPALTLREFARGMKGLSGAKSDAMRKWLLRYRRDDLEVSYYKTSRARTTSAVRV